MTLPTLPAANVTDFPPVSAAKLGLDRFPHILQYAEREWTRSAVDFDAACEPVYAVYEARRTAFLPCRLVVFRG